MNKVTVSGNLTRDVEMRYAQSGTEIANFGIAVNERRKQGDDWVDQVSFFDVTAFGAKGKAIHQYMQKGSKILIDGKLNYESWDDKDSGRQRSKVSIIVNEFEFMGAKSQEGQQQPQQPAFPTQQQAPANSFEPPNFMPNGEPLV